jgi:hypothetical protein
MRLSRPPSPGQPKPAEVLERSNHPAIVDGEQVTQVKNFWLVQDGWWTEKPVNRRYWEILTVKDRRLVVFHDYQTGRWYTQAA